MAGMPERIKHQFKRYSWYLLGARALSFYGERPLSEVPDTSGTRFVFVCGLHRSGTSVVHRALRDNPEVTSFHGTAVPEDEAQHLQNVFPSARHFGGPGRFAFKSAAHMTEDDGLTAPEFRDRLLRQWGAYLDFSKSFAVEKSPPNLIRSRYLDRLFPGSLFIFLVRHPIPVAMATTRRWNHGPVAESLAHWRRAYTIALSDIARLDSHVFVRYEDVVADPNFWLGKLFDYIGLDFTETTEHFFDANKGYFSQWEDLLVKEPDACADTLDEIAATMETFGYVKGSPYVLPTDQVPLLRSLV